MNKLKLTYQEIKSRLTGFSIPIFGISWQPDEAEIKIAKRVITQLEDRRVLYSPYELEVPRHCVSSVLEIRKMLTDEIGKVSQKSDLYNDLQLLRAACRKFLDDIHKVERDLDNYQSFSTVSGWIFLTALGELRGVFGIGIAKIAISYGLNLTGDLVKIIPVIEDNSKLKGHNHKELE
ncbi:DUF6650 family protein [Ignavibacteria bacterium 4148-Me]|uniref:DUF6650 family protein n=1 Tax=Rosettibacter primus TaxID=3111523 RepID=UPI00336BFDED